jgi:hypothetical protein
MNECFVDKKRKKQFLVSRVAAWLLVHLGA